MNKDIQVSVSHKGDVGVMSIIGDITAITGEVILQSYNEESISESPKILIIFDKDCYINSGGLAFLIDIASTARKKEQKIFGVGLSEHFKKIFHMVGLTRCITLFDTEESAMNELKQTDE